MLFCSLYPPAWQLFVQKTMTQADCPVLSLCLAVYYKQCSDTLRVCHLEHLGKPMGVHSGLGGLHRLSKHQPNLVLTGILVSTTPPIQIHNCCVAMHSFVCLDHRWSCRPHHTEAIDMSSFSSSKKPFLLFK